MSHKIISHRTIERGFNVGPYLTLLKISRYLKKDDVWEYIKGHSEITIPSTLKKPKEYLSEVIRKLVNKGELDLNLFSSGANETYFPIEIAGGLMQKVLVLKSNKENDREKLDYEKELIDYLDTILKNRYRGKGFLVPDSIEIIKFNGRYFHAMERIRGETLEEKIKRNSSELETDLERIVDFLALIHVNIPIHQEEFELERGKRDFEKTLRNLNDLGLEYDKTIFNCYDRTITNFIKDSLLVFNKDAHPRNWIIPSNKNLGAIDFEGGIIPQAYDLVKLMESMNYLDENQKNKLLFGYIDSYKRYLENIPEILKDFNVFNNVFKFQYLNLTLQYAFVSAGKWKIADKEYQEKILARLKNAQTAIDIIKRDYTNHGDYKNLQNCLTEIEEKLTTKF